MPEPGERQLDREKFGEKNKMFHSITLCLDMKGCPNRCRHCWMGWGPNGDMPEEDLAAAAADFAPFAENLELHDWDREPDYSDRYRERWELCRRLSGPRPHPPHFELASVWRLVRDGSYAPWLAGLGVEAVHLTLFGGEETTDWYTGRKGAYREILRAIEILLQNGIAPRIQAFASKRNLSELSQVEALMESLDLDRRCREIGREFACFVHQGSCDGKNMAFYNEVAQTIRETDRRIIIFFLTDRTDKVDRLYGFKLKGNDYIPKPFYPEELIAKINERFESDITSQDIEYLLGNTLFRPNLASLTYKGETHSLSVRQTEILAILAKNVGKVVDRDTILNTVWGDSSYANSLALNVQITYIRKLLTDPSITITSLKKKGYILTIN